MAKIDFNDLINPVGATSWHAQYGYSGLEGRSFNYSDNNPHMKLINDMLAAGNYKSEEISDLYNKAYQWEADQTKWIQQLEVDQAIKEEQREYDSPLAQVQRLREAGINPDISGLSGSGSGSGSGTSSGASSPDNTSSIGRTDPYVGKYYQLAAMQTAAQFAGTLTSGVSSIMNSVSNMRIIPSQIALNEANAGLSSAKAGEINALLEGKKKSLNLSNVAQSIQNSTATLQQLAEFSDLIAPDTADFTPILKSLGVSDENLVPYSDIIKQMHANPQMRDKYAKAELSARWSEAENAQYTDALVGKMTDLSQKMAVEQLEWDFNTTQLQNRISKILNNVDHADQVARNEMDAALVTGQSLGVSSMQFQLAEEQLAVDLEAFYSAISDRAVVLETIQREINDLEVKQKKFKSPQREATISALRAEQMAVRDMLSSQYYSVNTHLLTTAQLVYNNQRFLDENGWVKPESDLFRPAFFSSATFDDLIQHRRSDSEIARDNARNTIGFIQTAVDAANVARGFGFNRVYKQAHDDVQFRAGVAAGKAGGGQVLKKR